MPRKEFSAEDLGRFCMEMGVPVSIMMEWLRLNSATYADYERVKEAMMRGFEED